MTSKADILYNYIGFVLYRDFFKGEILDGNLILILPFVFGAVIGSFLNVCIHRLPLGLSVVSPPSRCPKCERHIPFYDNIPIFSYFILMGKCRNCGSPFSFRYALIELLTGAFAVFLFLKFGLTIELFAYFLFVSALIVITFIDLEHQIIPDIISLPGIAIGFALSFILPFPGVLNSVIGLLAGGGILIAIAFGWYFLTGTEGMGGGDIKLLAMVGAFLGWKSVLLTLLLGSFLGAFVGGIVMLIYGKNSKHPIPFGPFLAAGAVSYLFFGEELIGWYIMQMIGV
ncbi:MAG: prepilin peptidase [Deltaproteobacteria bacterium]|nr:prepilin peptidase [Deltaproteobacteria bacterium]